MKQFSIYLILVLFKLSYADGAKVFNFSSIDSNKPFVLFVLGFGEFPQETIDAKLVADNFYLSPYHMYFDFRVVPLLSPKSDYASVMRATKDRVIAISQEINNLPHKKIILAGHSSGSLMAIEISKRLKNKDITLVSIDGFAPTNLAPAHIPHTCWTATHGKVRSLNYSSAMTCKNIYIYKDTKCTSSMCLHFELINLSSAALNITSKNFKQLGYTNLQLNLIWLNPFMQWTQ